LTTIFVKYIYIITLYFFYTLESRNGENKTKKELLFAIAIITTRCCRSKKYQLSRLRGFISHLSYEDWFDMVQY